MVSSIDLPSFPLLLWWAYLLKTLKTSRGRGMERRYPNSNDWFRERLELSQRGAG